MPGRAPAVCGRVAESSLYRQVTIGLMNGAARTERDAPRSTLAARCEKTTETGPEIRVETRDRVACASVLKPRSREYVGNHSLQCAHASVSNRPEPLTGACHTLDVHRGVLA